jgi:hypothetical protein
LTGQFEKKTDPGIYFGEEFVFRHSKTNSVTKLFTYHVH